MGTWQGEKPLGAFDAIGHSNGSVVALTRGDLRLSKLPAFWLSGTKIAVEDVRLAEGFIAGVAMTERPFIEVATLTVCTSLTAPSSSPINVRPTPDSWPGIAKSGSSARSFRLISLPIDPPEHGMAAIRSPTRGRDGSGP